MTHRCYASLAKQVIEEQLWNHHIIEDRGLITAQKAYDIGLVTTVVPDGMVREEVDSVVENIGSGAPLVNRWHKKFVRNLVDGVDVTQEMKEEAYEAFQTEDYKEGIQAFLERRKPKFEGR